MAPPVRAPPSTVTAAASSWRRAFGSLFQPANTRVQEKLQDSFFEPEPVETLGPNARAAQERGITAVRHKTDCANLPEILKAMRIEAGTSTGKANYAYPHQGPLAKSFVQLTHRANEENEIENDLRRQCTLFLSLRVLDDPKPDHISRDWRMGQKVANVSASGESASGFARIIDDLTRNDSCGRDGTRKLHPEFVSPNEVVYSRPIELGAHLKGIAGPQPVLSKEEQLILGLKRTATWWSQD